MVPVSDCGNAAGNEGNQVARAVCIHRLPEVDRESLPEFTIAARTESVPELKTAVGAFELAAVILDLDEADALTAVLAVTEIRPGLPIVGITGGTDLKRLIAAQRAGCTYISTRPIDANDLVIALRHAVDQAGVPASEHDTFALMGTVGGAGATTIACHLLTELAELSGSPTALFDLDLEFGGVARNLDLSPRYTVADLAGVGAVDAVLLEKSGVLVRPNAIVFARPPSIHEAHAIDELGVRNVLRAATRTYRYSVVDLPRRLDAIAGAAIESCSRLLLVLQLTVPSIDNARRLIDALAAEGVGQDRVELVVNRFRRSIHNCTVEMVQEQLGQPVLSVVPNDYEAVNRAVDIGQALSSKSPVRSAIRQLAEKLIGRQEAQKPKNWLAKVGLRR